MKCTQRLNLCRRLIGFKVSQSVIENVYKTPIKAVMISWFSHDFSLLGDKACLDRHFSSFVTSVWLWTLEDATGYQYWQLPIFIELFYFQCNQQFKIKNIKLQIPLHSVLGLSQYWTQIQIQYLQNVKCLLVLWVSGKCLQACESLLELHGTRLLRPFLWLTPITWPSRAQIIVQHVINFNFFMSVDYCWT